MESFSLWLVPNGKDYLALKDLILEFSKIYHTPAFEPHVAILTNIHLSPEEIKTRLENVAPAFNPVEISFGTIGTVDVPQKGIVDFAKENPILSDLYKKTTEALGIPPGEYKPHLPLVLGDLPKTTPREIYTTVLTPLSFRAEGISIIATGGPIETWHEMGHLNFG